MQALQYNCHGGPEVLQWATIPRPEPGPGQVRVRLLAAGLAPFDAKLRAGALQAHFSVTFPHTPGRDGAGVVEAIGPGVSDWTVGDPVCVVAGGLQPGTCAQAVCVDAWRIVRRPQGLDTHQAAALMQPAISAWIAVMESARVVPGMRVLVLGGSGAVGGFMVQLCRHLGAEVSATCRSANCDHVQSLGAERAFAYDQGGVVGLRAQDVVFDLVGGAAHADAYPVLRQGGLMACLTAEPFTDQTARWGVRVLRVPVTDRPEVLAAVADLAERGVLQPRVAAAYPSPLAAQAHADLEAGRITRGRAVIDIPQVPA
jgi:NADPH:quinone reductase-like Zn-dependent oxidoreductase